LQKLNFKELAVTRVNSAACCGNLMTHIKSYQSFSEQIAFNKDIMIGLVEKILD